MYPVAFWSGELVSHFTASQDILPQVNWLILGSKLPGRVVPEHRIDLRLWLAAAVDSGEMFWLAVHVG